MIEMGKKYQTRGGRAVRILCVDMRGQYPVSGAVSSSPDNEFVSEWTADGINICNAWGTHNDLVPVPTKHGGWCLVDTDAPSYATREEAERAFTTGVYAVWNPCDDRYQIVHVTWED